MSARPLEDPLEVVPAKATCLFKTSRPSEQVCAGRNRDGADRKAKSKDAHSQDKVPPDDQRSPLRAAANVLAATGISIIESSLEVRTQALALPAWGLKLTSRTARRSSLHSGRYGCSA